MILFCCDEGDVLCVKWNKLHFEMSLVASDKSSSPGLTWIWIPWKDSFIFRCSEKRKRTPTWYIIWRNLKGVGLE